MFLISDNIDTKVGLRLAGIEGVVVHELSEVESALNKAVSDDSYAVIMITEKLEKLAKVKIDELKLKFSRPLIVTIPDRHGQSDKSAIERYVKESIGLSI